jgi:methyl-accepting chemotaxis protein
MKLTVKARLIGGFVILFALMILMAAVSLDKMTGMNDRIDTMADVSSTKIKLGARINQDAIAISRAEKNIILAKTTEEMNEYASFTVQTRSEMQERRSQLRELADAEGQIKPDQIADIW